MLSVRVTALICAVSVLPSVGLGKDDSKIPTREGSPRSQIQTYLDWIPASSETLVVLERPYRIPQKPDESTSPALDVVFREMHLMNMFETDVREVLAGQTIRHWIEASSRFRLPEFPPEVGQVNLTGCNQKYDGCHVLVFDDEATLDTDELFVRVLRQRDGKGPGVAAPKEHRIEGHRTIEYVVDRAARRRTRGGSETPSDTEKINAVWSSRYWITSPAKNVLLVATSRKFLAETLRKIRKPDQTAFPSTLDEWKYLGNLAPIWGMRHFPAQPTLRDLTDFRRRGTQTATGFTFEIDPIAKRARLTFLNCNQEAAENMQSIIHDYVYANTQFNTGPDGMLVAEIDWSKEPADVALRIKGSLAFWLQMQLGHGVVI